MVIIFFSVYQHSLFSLNSLTSLPLSDILLIIRKKTRLRAPGRAGINEAVTDNIAKPGAW